MFGFKKTKSKKTVDRSDIFTTGQIGRTRETTPEGYLLCHEVRVARIGKLMYGAGEVPVTADNTGLIVIERDAEELFSAKTIASFEGKPITNDHPDDWVSPENWKQLCVGTAKDVRRGEGIDADFLIADLLITDKEAIDLVLSGKIEISLGYDADYYEVSKGKGIQKNIVGNHIAIVDDGRCGSRCSIGDSFMPKKKTSFLDGLRKQLKRTVDEAVDEIGNTTDDEETEDDDEDLERSNTGDKAFQNEMRKFMKTMDKRLTSLEKGKTKDGEDPKLTEDEEEEPNTETGDTILDTEGTEKLTTVGVQSYTGDSFREVASRAEILAPGFKMQTTDTANNGDAVLKAKRNALKQSFATPEGQKAIPLFTGGNLNFDTMPAHTVDAAFIGASELIKAQNNANGVRHGISTKDFGRQPNSIADINQRNREYWKNK